MERASLLLLIACAVIGASMNADSDASVASAPDATLLPAVSAPPADAVVVAETAASDTPDRDAGTDAARQILKRLSVRHTALPARERERLADAIVEESARHALDPELVMAVIEVESAGYHLAVSHVGALGLMQLMPATGKELAEKLGVDWKGPDTLFDPLINVQLGTAYLRELADRYDGNFDIALAAYNWGPGRIDRRIRRGARVPKLYIEQVRQAELRYVSIESTRS